eukprot:3439925-Rhodomonas_salina.8
MVQRSPGSVIRSISTRDGATSASRDTFLRQRRGSQRQPHSHLPRCRLEHLKGCQSQRSVSHLEHVRVAFARQRFLWLPGLV